MSDIGTPPFYSKLKWLFLSIFCLLNGGLFAQILNAEKFYQQVDSTNSIKGDLDLALSTIKQTHTIHRFHSKLNLTKRIGKSDLTFAGSTYLLISQGDNLIDRSFGHLRYRINPHKNLTPELFSQFQWDGIRGLERRLLLGGNARFRIFENDGGAMNMGIGIMNEREDWNYTGSSISEIRAIDTLISTNVIKYNFYVGSYRKITKSVTAGVTAYMQGKYTDPLNPRVAGIANVDFKISRNLSYSVAFDWFYDSKPVVPIQNLYYTMKNKIVFHFAPKKSKGHGGNGHGDSHSSSHNSSHDSHNSHDKSHDSHDTHSDQDQHSTDSHDSNDAHSDKDNHDSNSNAHTHTEQQQKSNRDSNSNQSKDKKLDEKMIKPRSSPTTQPNQKSKVGRPRG